mmetsp:Transcript_19897/g.34188  ORF Transcript_19897/g.34188 Transcript_19897/m.34188 type:complete len:233 (-) Transcript_19897:42-740(-)
MDARFSLGGRPDSLDARKEDRCAGTAAAAAATLEESLGPADNLRAPSALLALLDASFVLSECGASGGIMVVTVFIVAEDEEGMPLTDEDVDDTLDVGNILSTRSENTSDLVSSNPPLLLWTGLLLSLLMFVLLFTDLSRVLTIMGRLVSTLCSFGSSSSFAKRFLSDKREPSPLDDADDDRFSVDSTGFVTSGCTDSMVSELYIRVGWMFIPGCCCTCQQLVLLLVLYDDIQ